MFDLAYIDPAVFTFCLVAVASSGSCRGLPRCSPIWVKGVQLVWGVLWHPCVFRRYRGGHFALTPVFVLSMWGVHWRTCVFRRYKSGMCELAPVCVWEGIKQCAWARSHLCVRRCITVFCFSFFHYHISWSEASDSWRLAVLYIIRGGNSPQFSKRFRAKDMLINLDVWGVVASVWVLDACVWGVDVLCIIPGHLWHGHAIMRRGYLFKTCYISTALRSPWCAVGLPLLSSVETLCMFFSFPSPSEQLSSC